MTDPARGPTTEELRARALARDLYDRRYPTGIAPRERANVQPPKPLLEKVGERVEALTAVLVEIRDAYAEYYESGSLDRLLNGEALIRGLWPPLDSEGAERQ